MTVTNCPINEETGDGFIVGRCWFGLDNGKCPRHGNVSIACRRFENTGKLTPERIHYTESKGGES